MARPKKLPLNPATEPTLPAQPVVEKPVAEVPAPPVSSVPSLVEYQFNGLTWRCGRFDALVTELGEPAMTVETIGKLHEIVSGMDRSWKILRRLFGVMPVLPPSDYPVDDMRTWGRDELCGDMGISRAQLQQELDGIRGTWRGVGLAMPVAELPKMPTMELALDEDNALLKEFALPTKFQDMAERNWFSQRVHDFEKLLREKTTSGLARNILIQELQMFRLDQAILDVDAFKPGSDKYRLNMSARRDMDKTYQELLEQVRKQAPWFSAVAGKYAFAGVLSDVTRAMQEYYQNGNTELADGIFTATEIEVELRRSVQASEPRYRAGLVVYLNAAKSFLFDPRWKPKFQFGTFKKIDEAWKASIIKSDAENGTPLPDLEHEGEYPDLEVVMQK